MGLLLPTALLETRGARTGQPRRNAVIYFHDGDRVTIIASKLGLPEHPAWFHNLRANPDVTLGGQPFQGLNGGPDFRFNEAVSFVIECEDQAEVDRLWEALIAGGGEPGPCGWLKDRFGLSWQIVPRRLNELLYDPEPGRSRRAMEAMLTMGKLDVAELERAADAAG